ncbi:MAG TPA: hypothetical protein VG929_08985 [Actinomycetota bacterium]|nr:hypothetical protein [Actinomycetota bacterium]
MFRRLIVGLAAAAVAVTATVASAGPGPGYFASDNVEFVTHVPLNNDSAGARLVGDHFYITSSRGLLIYDVSDPVNPKQLSFLPLFQTPYFAEEDPDTNGSILLVGGLDRYLHVIDVEDKTNPQVIGKLLGADSHTTTCVLNCRWAYNSGGDIIDLRDPTEPKIAGSWSRGSPAGSAHDVTEVAPGIVMTSSSPMLLLDARKDPAKPKLIASVRDLEPRYIHGNHWPRAMKDDFLLVQGETTSGASTCGDEEDGSFMTFDATKWRKTRSFRMIDEMRLGTGLPTDGKMPLGTFCAHWFEVHPSFRNGGLVAMAWYENGSHFLRVSNKGKISHDGYFLPAAGSTSAIYWVTDEIAYTVDYNRGIDILRYTGKP